MTTALIYDSRFLHHETNFSPECPERLQVAIAALQRDASLWDSLLKLKPDPATVTDILRCHDKKLIQEISDFCSQGGGYLDDDTFVGASSYDIALLSAGAAICAVDAVLKKQAQNAFSLARPPGHHAIQNRAMGFCLFNNAAIAARYAQNQYQLQNILIIDWDVHHGNGTQDIFYDDPTVFYFSMHESPFYPDTGHTHETGSKLGKGTTLNIPVPAGIPADEYKALFKNALATIEKQFKPDLIIISAGFDARKNDPLANLLLLEEDFYELTEDVMAFAEKNCEGRLISLLEGGYKLDTLGESILAHVKALMGQ